MGHSNDTSKKKYNVVTLLKVKWRALAAQWPTTQINLGRLPLYGLSCIRLLKLSKYHKYVQILHFN